MVRAPPTSVIHGVREEAMLLTIAVPIPPMKNVEAKIEPVTYPTPLMTA